MAACTYPYASSRQPFTCQPIRVPIQSVRVVFGAALLDVESLRRRVRAEIAAVAVRSGPLEGQVAVPEASFAGACRSL